MPGLLQPAADDPAAHHRVPPVAHQGLARGHGPLGLVKHRPHRAVLLRVEGGGRGLCPAHKPDSQDICFVPDGNYPAFLQRYGGMALREGDFVDTQGRVLGTRA